MRRQHHGAMQHVRDVNVGDEGPRAERQFPAPVALQTMANAAVFDRLRHGATGFGLLNELDRVDDLHISGAAAQMPVDRARDILPRQFPSLIGQPFRAQHQAGRAEAALQASGCLKRVGVELALVVGHTLQRNDRPPLHQSHPHPARHPGRSIDQRDTGTAFALRATPRLDRFYFQDIAKHVQQRLIRRGVDLAGFSVEAKVDGCHGTRSVWFIRGLRHRDRMTRRSPDATGYFDRPGPAVIAPDQSGGGWRDQGGRRSPAGVDGRRQGRTRPGRALDARVGAGCPDQLDRQRDRNPCRNRGRLARHDRQSYRHRGNRRPLRWMPWRIGRT